MRRDPCLDKAGEEWRVVPGYGRYEASTFGRVRCENQEHGFKYILREYQRPRGYCCVRMEDTEGARRTELVHRVVAETWVKREEGKGEVDHVDGDKHNNRVENLRWLSHRENMLAAVERLGGHWRKGKRNEGAMVAITMIDPEKGTVRDFAGLADAVRWLSEQQVAAGGVAMEGQRVSPNIIAARDRARTCQGMVWVSHRVKEAGKYLLGLKGRNDGSALGMMMERGGWFGRGRGLTGMRNRY